MVAIGWHVECALAMLLQLLLVIMTLPVHHQAMTTVLPAHVWVCAVHDQDHFG